MTGYHLMPYNSLSIPGAYRFQYFDPPFSEGGSTSWKSLFRHSMDKERSKRPKGVNLIPKPYFYTEVVTRHLAKKIVLYRNGSKFAERTGVWTSAPAVDPYPFYKEGKSLAIIKALTNLKAQKVNMGVAMAEAKSTARFLGDGFETIAKAYMRMKRLDPKGAVKALRSNPGGKFRSVLRGANTGGGRAASGIPQAWLQVQYGLLPLMSDMDGAVQELLGRDRSLFSVTVKGEHTETLFNSFILNEWGASSTSDHLETHRNAVSLTYAPKDGAMIAAARCGTLNPLEVLWEWTPFSVIIDWALPVGDFLHVLDAAAGWQFHKGSHTSFVRHHASQNPVKDTPGQPGYVYVVSERGGVNSEGVRFTRDVFVNSPLPAFPPPKNPLSLGHMANGLAMLVSVFGGSSRPPMYHY